MGPIRRLWPKAKTGVSAGAYMCGEARRSLRLDGQRRPTRGDFARTVSAKRLATHRRPPRANASHIDKENRTRAMGVLTR